MQTRRTSDTKFYGASRVAYQPLNTTLQPRVALTNDVINLNDRTCAVRLQDATFATIDFSDFQALIVAGWKARWTARPVTGGHTYPSMNFGGKIFPVARLILDARKGERIGYRNGDRSDLRRENLVLTGHGNSSVCSKNRKCPAAPTSAIGGKNAQGLSRYLMRDRGDFVMHFINQDSKGDLSIGSAEVYL